MSNLVLIIDDEIEICEMLSAMLNVEGIESEVCIHGENAINKLEKEPDRYSLIILDLYMPVMDGLTTFKHIRKLNQTTPIYIASGYGEGAKTDALLLQGATGVLPKPIRLKTVKELVAKHLKK